MMFTVSDIKMDPFQVEASLKRYFERVSEWHGLEAPRFDNRNFTACKRSQTGRFKTLRFEFGWDSFCQACHPNRPLYAL